MSTTLNAAARAFIYLPIGILSLCFAITMDRRKLLPSPLNLRGAMIEETC